ncbi:MAG: hypothetical protein AB7I50_12760 [Vicinamibacterales bacterium]
MSAVRLLFVLLCAWVSSGCYVVSLHGLADDASTVADEQIVGHWENADDGVDVLITADEWRTYAVVVRDTTGEQQFTARVTEIGHRRYLDLTVRAGAELKAALLPVHLLGRFSTKNDTLVVELLAYDWVRGRFDRGSLILPAVLDERDAIVLTAKRSRLREWLAANATSSALFEEAMVLSRAPSAGSR